MSLSDLEFLTHRVAFQCLAACVLAGLETVRSASSVVNAVEVFLFPNNDDESVEVSPAPQLPPMTTRKRLRLKPLANRLACEDAQALGTTSSTPESETEQEDCPTFLPGWKRIVDERTGHVYYHDEKSGKSLWEAPNWKAKDTEKEPVPMEEAEVTDVTKEIPVQSAHEDKPILTCLATREVKQNDKSVGVDAKVEEKMREMEIVMDIETEDDARMNRRRSRSASPKFSYVKEISQFYGRNEVDLG